jgi:hypothetical protein
MLAVKEVSRVERIERHGLKTLMSLKWRARPFPDAAHLRLARELVASGGYWHRMPVPETNIGFRKVKE